MKKLTIIISLFTLLFLGANLAEAKVADKEYKLPSNAKEIAPDVFSLGTAYDKGSKSLVEGYAFVHKKNEARSGTVKNPKPAVCYGFLGAEAKWKNIEDWTLFPLEGADADLLLTNTASNIAKWETAAGASIDILGNGSFGVGTPGDPNILDDNNEVSFGPITDSNTIAVTIIWGTFGGPTFNRKIVAWDQVFNTYYPWSTSGESGKMDYENISTHELGHSVGMADIYTSSCSQASMYGYASTGETIKRDLDQADIKGISTLY